MEYHDDDDDHDDDHDDHQVDEDDKSSILVMIVMMLTYLPPPYCRPSLISSEYHLFREAIVNSDYWYIFGNIGHLLKVFSCIFSEYILCL